MRWWPRKKEGPRTAMEQNVGTSAVGRDLNQAGNNLIIGLTAADAFEISRGAAQEVLEELRDGLHARWERRMLETLKAAAEARQETVEQLLCAIRDNPEVHDIFARALDAT